MADQAYESDSSDENNAKYHDQHIITKLINNNPVMLWVRDNVATDVTVRRLECLRGSLQGIFTSYLLAIQVTFLSLIMCSFSLYHGAMGNGA